MVEDFIHQGFYSLNPRSDYSPLSTPAGSTDAARSAGRKLARTLRARLSAEFDPLMTSYLEAAKGAYVMFARDSHGKWTRVTDADTMERCLQRGETFYRLEQSKPDVRALTDALDRLFGKPTQSVDVNAEIDHTQTTKVLHIHQPEACPQCGYKFQDDALCMLTVT